MHVTSQLSKIFWSRLLPYDYMISAGKGEFQGCVPVTTIYAPATNTDFY